MIRIQLYRLGRAVVDQITADEAGANRLLDQLINDVHKGTHGTGQFGLYADRVDDNGLFVGSFFRAPDFFHPAKCLLA